MPSYLGPGLLLAVAAALPAQPFGELFAQGRADGPDSPAARDLRRHGAAAVTFLVGVLQQDDTTADTLHALEQLMRMGALAEPAVPTLLRVAERGDRAGTLAVIALGEIGPFVGDANRRQAATALLELHRASPSLQLGRQVARAWHRLQVSATSDLELLLAHLRSGNPFRIELACQLLVELGPPARAAMPLVAELLRRPRFGAPGVEQPDHPELAVPGAGECIADVRRSLFVLVQQVDPDNPVGLPLVLERLRASAPVAQPELLRQLGRMGPPAAPAVPVLAEFAQRGAPLVAREAVIALGLIGAGDDRARGALALAQQSTDPQLAACARATLRQFGPPTR